MYTKPAGYLHATRQQNKRQPQSMLNPCTVLRRFYIKCHAMSVARGDTHPMPTCQRMQVLCQMGGDWSLCHSEAGRNLHQWPCITLELCVVVSPIDDTFNFIHVCLPVNFSVCNDSNVFTFNLFVTKKYETSSSNTMIVVEMFRLLVSSVGCQ